jgi:hypothetical protein
MNAFWSQTVQRLANFPLMGGLTALLEWRRYPGVLALYSAGLAAVSADRLETLRAVLSDAKVFEDGKPERSVATAQYAESVLQTEWAQHALFGGNKRYTPMSDRVRDVLRESLRSAVPDEKRYDELFDRFEYLLSLKCFAERKRIVASGWAPIGRFSWHDGGRTLFTKITVEATERGPEYPPVKAKLFDSSQAFLELLKEYAAQIIPLANRNVF